MSAGKASLLTTWRHGTADIPAKGLAVSRSADPRELAEAAGYLEIPAVEKLRVDYQIAPAPGGCYRMTGRLRARVVQPCGITLEPVRTDIDEEIDVEFREPEDMPESQGHEQEALEAVEHEPIENQSLAAGRVVLETLLAALPRFPRAEGASLEQSEAGPRDGGTAGPFAGLAGWKPKPK